MSTALQKNEELSKALLKAETEEELKQITSLFNLNLKKKSIIRASKLSELQDSITAEMSARIENRADEFSNTDLLNYMKTIQDIIGKTDANIETITPAVLIQENHIHAEDGASPSLSRASKDKIRSAIEELLAQKEVAQDVEEEL